jgi:hypothetical protein
MAQNDAATIRLFPPDGEGCRTAKYVGSIWPGLAISGTGSLSPNGGDSKTPNSVAEFTCCNTFPGCIIISLRP